MKEPPNLIEKLKELLEFSALINSSLEINTIKEQATQAVMKLANCEAASLLLFDEETQELYFDVALGEMASEIKTIRLKLGQGIAGWVAEHKEPVIIHDVQSDPRFYRVADEISGFVTRNMLCLPVMSKGRLFGVLQAINKKEGSFNELDLELIGILANQIAVALENAKLYEELKEKLYEMKLLMA